jgi:hypothetical protein
MNERISIADKKHEAKSQNLVAQIRSKTDHYQSMNSPIDRILFLQRTIGNQAVTGLIKSGALQAKLRVGQPGDVYEQEADRVAEQVMRMPEPVIQPILGCPFVKGSPCKEKEEILQTREVGGETTQSSPAVESRINSLRDGGQPLPGSVSDFFEPRFGHDFSRVRVHSDAAAAQSAQDVSAKAYTAGHNIVFGAGQFVPGTQEGQRLIAHELTHVVQQSGSSGIRVDPRHEKRGLSPIIAQLHQHRPVVARKENGPSKEEIEKSKKQRDAVALFWNDMHTHFPGEGRKLAGSGYDDTVDYLTTSFQEGETMEGGVKTIRSAPTIYVGKKYLSEQDIAKRKAAIRAELDKIDMFRYDNARIDNDDLSNTVITSKIGNLDIFGKRDYLQRLEAQKFSKNDKVKEYIRRSMPSTPLVAGAVARAEGGFALQFENIKIVVKPDVFNSAAVAANEAHTEIERTDSETYKTKPGFNWGKDQKVSSMTFTPSIPQLIYKVETHYGPQSDPSYTSGYGVGTRPEDAAGNTSIRFHEGMHGNIFIQFIKENISKNSFPVFDGKVGDDKDDFGKKVEAYERKVLAFDQMIKDAVDASVQRVDCVGKTIEQFHAEKGTTSKVKCKKP